MKPQQELTNEEIEQLLNEYYTRYQRACVEVTEKSFPKFNFQSVQVFPVRWNVAMVRDQNGRLAFNYSYFPVTTWEEAGADVHFPDCEYKPDYEEYWKKFQARCDELNRPVYGQSGSSWLFPVFDGNDWNSLLDDGETAVMRELSENFIKEHESIFQGLRF